MNYRVRLQSEPSQTLYAVLFNNSGQAWDGSSFVTFTGVQDDFDISLTEGTNRTGYYSADLGTELPVDTYYEEYWIQKGANPSRSDDILLGIESRSWVWDKEYSRRFLDYYTEPREYTYTYTLTDGSGNPVPDAHVWALPSENSSFALQSGLTDSNGQVEMQLQPGTVWFDAHKDGVSFDHLPESKTLSAVTVPEEDYTIELVYNETGASLYCLLFNSDGAVWNGSSFVTFDGDNSVGLDLAEGADRTHFYSTTLTSQLPADDYEEEIWQQAGASKDRSADYAVGLNIHPWSGAYSPDLARVALGSSIGTQQFTYSVTDEDGNPIPNARVRVTLGSTGEKVIATGRADQFGDADFFLPSGTYYFWPMQAGVNFDVPDEESV